MGKALSEDVFQLRQKLPEDAMHEAICHRLSQLKALTVVMENQDFKQYPPNIVQGYAFSLSNLVEELQTLFFALWDKE